MLFSYGWTDCLDASATVYTAFFLFYFFNVIPYLLILEGNHIYIPVYIQYLEGILQKLESVWGETLQYTPHPDFDKYRLCCFQGDNEQITSSIM